MSGLRSYQEEALCRVRAGLALHPRVCLVMPTGSGKTRTSAAMTARAVERGRRVLFLAHRAELIDQTAATFAELGLVVGGCSASAQTPPNPYAPVQLATIQTLLARNLRPEADFLIGDECHHLVADEWLALMRDYEGAHVVGLTATPERSDGRGLGELFGQLVVGVTVKQLIKVWRADPSQGLVPCEVIRPKRYLSPGEIAQHPVDAYVEHAAGRPTIVFARGVELAEGYAAEFNARGIRAACIHGEMPWAERTLYLDAFKRGEISVLVNVFVLTEGFDAPETSCVILARGCSTAGTYLQMVGRALRPAPGKTDALVIDLRGVSHEFGRPDDDRLFSLDGKGIRLKDKAIYCPVCGAEREAGEGCAACGWLPTGEPMKGDKVVGEPLVKYAAKKAEDDDARARTLARWMSVAAVKGYKPGWTKAKYAAVYGAPPPPEVVAAAVAMRRSA